MPEVDKTTNPKDIQKMMVSASTVARGISYRGDIKLCGAVFDYTLRLPRVLAEVDAEMKGKRLTPEGLFNGTTIEVKVKGRPIELTNGEKGFFFTVGTDVACTLYSNETEEEVQEARLMNARLALWGASLESSLEKTASIDINHPDIQSLLRKAGSIASP
jgi:hypothetical protein